MITFLRKFYLTTLVAVFICISTEAQVKQSKITPSKVAVKTNLIYDATSTINLGVEIGIAKNMTLNLSGNYNPWTFSNGRKFRHWLVQPEFRYWLTERFSGHFFGVHVHYAQYNVSQILLLSTRDLRYQGNLCGIGISYGYQWRLGRHWNLEAEVGLGYARLDYDMYDCKNCGQYIGKAHKNYFGPTKIGISIAYMIQ